MYEAHFGLRHRPFRSAPDNAGYYPATSHERALVRLDRAIEDDEGMALLTADPGMGKTLLCHRLIEKRGQETCTVFLTNSHLSDRADLLQAILFDLELPYEHRSEQELRLAFTEALMRNFAAGRRTLLLIDEAQNLELDLLEEVRLLGNLEGCEGKAIQVVLVAQSSFEKRLRRPGLASFRQRLAVGARLEPLEMDESIDYLVHHLRLAGGRCERIITEEALAILARGARGVPRLLNQAAHQALTFAFEAGIKQVDAEAALEALSDRGLNSEFTVDEPADESAFSQKKNGQEVEPLAGTLRKRESDTGVSESESAAPNRLAPTPRWPA